MHSLLTNPVMFGEFLTCAAGLKVRPRLIVSVTDWKRTVKSRFFKPGRRAEISGYLGNQAAFLVDTYLMARAYDRLKLAQGSGLEVQLVDVAELNQNAGEVAQRIAHFAQAKVEFKIPILVRGIEWTGGRTPPFGREHASKSFPSLGRLQAALLNTVDPTQVDSKIFRGAAVALTLILAIACLRAPYFFLYTSLRVIRTRRLPTIAYLESAFPEITVASQIVREIQALARGLG